MKDSKVDLRRAALYSISGGLLTAAFGLLGVASAEAAAPPALKPADPVKVIKAVDKVTVTPSKPTSPVKKERLTGPSPERARQQAADVKKARADQAAPVKKERLTGPSPERARQQAADVKKARADAAKAKTAVPDPSTVYRHSTDGFEAKKKADAAKAEANRYHHSTDVYRSKKKAEAANTAPKVDPIRACGYSWPSDMTPGSESSVQCGNAVFENPKPHADIAHRALEGWSYAPVLGRVFAGANAVLYAVEGNWEEATNNIPATGKGNRAVKPAARAADNALPLTQKPRPANPRETPSRVAETPATQASGRNMPALPVKSSPRASESRGAPVRSAKPGPDTSSRTSPGAGRRAPERSGQRTGAPAPQTKSAPAAREPEVTRPSTRQEQGRSTEAEKAKERKTADSCQAPNSFVPGTMVLMGDGGYKPIEQIKVGDRVAATDPTSGQSTSRPVSATIVGSGEKKLVDVTVDTDGDAGDQTGTVMATDGHPFWSDDQKRWINAGQLVPGQRLKVAGSRPVIITAARHHAAQQTVHNLTIDDIHTYYVLAGTSPVLVHNAGCDEFAAKLQKRIGGEIKTFTGPAGRARPIGSRYKLDPNEEIWFHHTVVVKNGRVYDQFTGSKGMPIDEWKAQWEPNDLDFGF